MAVRSSQGPTGMRSRPRRLPLMPQPSDLPPSDEGRLFDPEAERAQQRGRKWMPKVRQNLADPDREWQEEERARDEKLKEEEEEERRQAEEDAKGERTGDETLDESLFSALRDVRAVAEGFEPVTGDLGGGGLTGTDTILLLALLAGLTTGGGSGVASGALKAAPAIGRAAAAGGTGLLALLGLAGPASAETPADASPAGAAVGALRDRSRGRSGRVGR